MKQKGLGRGLDAIFGSEHLDARLKPMTEMAEISVSAIFPNPTQPRTEFDEEALEELADSIRTLGVIQPITVKRTDDGRYLIISGERRWRAARKAGLESLPAYIREVDDENLHAMALVENIQREDLNAIEIARGFGDLSENAEYDAAKEAQGMLEMRINKLKATIADAKIIDESKLKTDSVQILNKVELKNVKNGMKMIYTIVSESEANLKEGKISVNTPIAQGLLGKKVGDIAEIKVPQGMINLEVVNISF